jgi:DNA polymerase III alpha subunit
VNGTVSSRNGELKFAVESTGFVAKDSKNDIENLESENKSKANKTSVYIKLKDSQDTNKLNNLKQIIDDNQGEAEVVLVIGDDDKRQAIRLPARVSIEKETIVKLEDVVGKENIAIK